jgi:tetratricopeptide (TPR) repeat protein
MAKRIKPKGRTTRTTGLADFEAMATDDLVAIVEGIGVAIDESSFVARAKLAGSVRDLFEDELMAIHDDNARRALMWCGLVLWDRWLPDQASAERIRIWMSDESPAATHKAWSAIQPRIPREATSAAAIDKALDIATFAGWSLRAARTSELGLVFIDALLEQLRDEGAPWRQGMTERRVRALAALGRRDEAYALARDMIAQAPDAPYGHTALASLLLEDNKMDEAREAMTRAHDALEKLAAQ